MGPSSVRKPHFDSGSNRATERLLQSKRKPGKGSEEDSIFDPLTLLVRAGEQKEMRAKTIIKVVVVNVEFISQIP
jgi:hypothetical protein